jgi:hypothetical protein
VAFEPADRHIRILENFCFCFRIRLMRYSLPPFRQKGLD